MNPKIGIILGSDSDFPYMEKGISLLEKFDITYKMEVSSAHRTPERTIQLIRDFENDGIEVIVAAAGGAAHLPGVIASHTLLPVLGVPIDSKLSGVDSLYSIVQMPEEYRSPPLESEIPGELTPYSLPSTFWH